MTKWSINPCALAQPSGPYSLVTVVPPGGRWIFCSGVVAFDATGVVIGKGDIVAQTRQVMENLKAALEAVGANLSDVVKLTNYVVEASDYAKMAPVRREYFREPYPASTLIVVKSLLDPEYLVEIEAIAVVYDADHYGERSAKWPRR